MIIYGGANAVHCKMFMGTFTGTTLQWFSGLPDRHIISFDQFFELFRERFFVNQAKPLISYDLFSVKQRHGESLKNYLNRFWVFIVKLQTHDEALIVNTFEQEVMAWPFSDSLIRNSAETFAEIWRWAVAHINLEEVVSMKQNTLYLGQNKPKEGSRFRPLRVNETTTEKRTDSRRAPYPTRKNVPKAKAGRTWHFGPSSGYLTRNWWAYQGLWKSWSSLRSLTRIWGCERRPGANSTRDLGMTPSNV